MAKAFTADEFINRCKNKFGNKYDYSKVKYKNSKSKILIKCNIHDWFIQSAWRHLNNKIGCPKCVLEYMHNVLKKSTQKFIEDSIKIHGNKYDYSKIKYESSFDKVEIICKRHGSFFQFPHNHLSGNGCPKCRNLYTQDEFINISNKIHNNYYNYSLVKYEHNKKYINIICPKHGIFKQKASTHLSGKGCPKCNNSKGELKIINWLNINNIKYIKEMKFNDCINIKTGHKLRYDFYLPKFNILIEYDGKQHFVINTHWSKETETDFNNRIFKDNIKTNYAKEHNIKLIRIKYVNYKTIDKILNFELKNYIKLKE